MVRVWPHDIRNPRLNPVHPLTHQLHALRQGGVSAILGLTVGPSILLILVMDLLINWQERPAMLEAEILMPCGWGHLVAA